MLKIGKYTFRSRLFLGTGKFPSLDIQQAAVEASGAEVLTFAVRRLNISDPNQPNFLERLDLSKYTLLPNTAGATSVEEALRIARLARASKLCDMIKVEIIGDPKTLLPDPVATLEATRILVEEGFTVLPYTSDDPILAKRLEEAGAHAIMPGGSPIGSGLGLLNPHYLSLIIEQAKVPGHCRRGDRIPGGCGSGDGAGSGRGAAEHRRIPGEGSGEDGPGDEIGRRSGEIGFRRREGFPGGVMLRPAVPRRVWSAPEDSGEKLPPEPGRPHRGAAPFSWEGFSAAGSGR